MSGSSTDTLDGRADMPQLTGEEREEAERRHHHHHHHHPHHIQASSSASVEVDVNTLSGKDAKTVEIAVMASQKAEEFITLDPDDQKKFLSDLFSGLHQQPANKEFVEGIFDFAKNRSANKANKEFVEEVTSLDKI